MFKSRFDGLGGGHGRMRRGFADDHATLGEPGHGRGRGGRLGRLFAHGDLHLVVLHLIAERPRHGYELIKSIEAAVNGAYSPSPGTIYPALTLLEEQGFVDVGHSDGSKKLYTVTDAGRAYLNANRATVEAMLVRMAEVGASRAEVPAPVIRAMENLKLALRMRMERVPLTDEAARAIADALDRAVADIERT
ncbi:PadR family transcriptional regulator [Blastochloris viridis]|uniref:Transcriptional regulator n=1 Tax=Blastochloris viridis TaxID=1079 RepID=A0A0H5BDD7_BLAVI|nr:PadR family transcriptional regulator [Blastochloris viridis]ALK09875.1 Transcriptional regulator YqjI [Blastochloris viridis]BAS00221.1 transcriptional regulator [Blastochloris viridis]CUU42538.1 Transcriptional regulator YqjI [Blastochloris viridis]